MSGQRQSMKFAKGSLKSGPSQISGALPYLRCEKRLLLSLGSDFEPNGYRIEDLLHITG